MFVDITTLSIFTLDHSTAGMRYARDFPIPVPASMSAHDPSLKDSHTYSTISFCPSRSSKPGIVLLKGPPFDISAFNFSASTGLSISLITGSTAA